MKDAAARQRVKEEVQNGEFGRRWMNAHCIVTIAFMRTDQASERSLGAIFPFFLPSSTKIVLFGMPRAVEEETLSIGMLADPTIHPSSSPDPPSLSLSLSLSHWGQIVPSFLPLETSHKKREREREEEAAIIRLVWAVRHR